MITKNKKSSMSMLRKMSIIPVALVAMYLFAFNSESGFAGEPVIQTALPAIAAADLESNASPEVDDEIILFALLEVKPLFNSKDADAGFREYVNSKIIYPKEAQEKGISGRVIAEFIIEIDGSISNVKLLRGADPLLDNEVLRVINSSPKWTPGKHEGKPVRVMYQFPFEFRLHEQTSPPPSPPQPASEPSTVENKPVSEDNFDNVFLFADAKVEVKPLFNSKNADAGYREYVASKIIYPKEAQEKGISGRVITEFIIEIDGSISNVKLLRGVDPLLDNEVLRVINSSPQWTPGKHEGNPVRVMYQFPFVFRLN